MIKRCIICGKDFTASPSDKTVTCSLPCRKERTRRSASKTGRRWSEDKRKQLSERGQTTNLKQGTPAALQSPIAGPFETNYNALEWVIRSPDGVTYQCRNLNLWLREHADLLPGTPEQARAGLMQVKRSMQGKTKRKVSTWKRWTVVNWFENKKTPPSQ